MVPAADEGNPESYSTYMSSSQCCEPLAVDGDQRAVRTVRWTGPETAARVARRTGPSATGVSGGGCEVLAGLGGAEVRDRG
jgi:hypothetical protein